MNIKNYFALFLILSVCYNSFSQEEKGKFSRIFKDTTVVKTTLEFNEEKNEWLKSWAFEYTFNSEGKVISEIYKQAPYSGAEPGNYSKKEFSYNPKGIKNLEEEYKWNYDGWRKTQIIRWIFDEKENNIEIMTQMLNKDQWYDAIRITQTLNDKNELLSAETVNWVNTGWIPTYRTDWKYENEKIAASHESRWLANAFQKEGGHAYAYDESGKLSKRTTLNFINGKWVNRSYVLYSYDAKGNILVELDQEDGVNRYRKVKTYNEIGNQLTITEQLWENNAWKNFSKIVFTYDVLGRLLSETGQKFDGKNWTDDTRHSFTYLSAK